MADHENNYDSILRRNRHIERDPNVTIKVKDGGRSFLEEIEPAQSQSEEGSHPILKFAQPEESPGPKTNRLDIISFILG